MKKRLTKQQKEAQEIAALEQRLADMARGAYGYSIDFDNEQFISFAGDAGMGAFGRWIAAISHEFNKDEHYGRFLLAPSSFENFDSPKKAAEYLHRNGVRA